MVKTNIKVHNEKWERLTAINNHVKYGNCGMNLQNDNYLNIANVDWKSTVCFVGFTEDHHLSAGINSTIDSVRIWYEYVLVLYNL